MKAGMRLLILVGAFWLSATASAQVVVTVNATAYDGSLGLFGYTVGQPYTFVFTTGTTFANNADCHFSSTENLWWEKNTSENQLWASVSGTGVSGTYVRPTDNPTAPYSYLQTFDTSGFYVEVQHSIIGYGMGLQTPSGTGIRQIHFQATIPASFSYASTYSEPGAYFSQYVGTYSATSVSPQNFVVDVSNLMIANFTINSITIAVIPEPLAYTALVALGAFAFVILRRTSASR